MEKSDSLRKFVVTVQQNRNMNYNRIGGLRLR